MKPWSATVIALLGSMLLVPVYAASQVRVHSTMSPHRQINHVNFDPREEYGTRKTARQGEDVSFGFLIHKSPLLTRQIRYTGIRLSNSAQFTRNGPVSSYPATMNSNTYPFGGTNNLMIIRPRDLEPGTYSTFVTIETDGLFQSGVVTGRHKFKIEVVITPGPPAPPPPPPAPPEEDPPSDGEPFSGVIPVDERPIQDPNPNPVGPLALTGVETSRSITNPERITAQDWTVESGTVFRAETAGYRIELLPSCLLRPGASVELVARPFVATRIPPNHSG